MKRAELPFDSGLKDRDIINRDIADTPHSIVSLRGPETGHLTPAAKIPGAFRVAAIPSPIMARCRSLLAGTLFALLAVAQAAPSPNHIIESRQTAAAVPKNCDKTFFNSVIAAAGLQAQVADKSPYTPDNETSTYAANDLVLYYANHVTELRIPDICGVRIALTEPNRTNIALEMYLPSPANWNNRSLTVGNGGFSGRTSRIDMFSRAIHGWAVMSTNVGHEYAGSDLNWAEDKPEVQKDWAWRAMAKSVPIAKAIVAAYYKDAPNRKLSGSYYAGCSTGGRQGIRQIEADPKSFDGMLIGAPAWNVRSAMPVISRIGWLADTYQLKFTNADPTLITRIYDLVYATCNKTGSDTSTGDGVIGDSAACLEIFRKNGPTGSIWSGLDCPNDQPAVGCVSTSQRKAFLTIIEEFKTLPQNSSYAGDGFDISGIKDMVSSSYLADASFSKNFPQQFAKYFLKGINGREPVVWDNDEHGSWLLADAIQWDKNVGGANAKPSLLNNGEYKGKTILYTGTADGFVSSIGTRRAFNDAGGTSNNNLAYFELPGMPHCVDLGSGGDNPPWYIGGVGLANKAPNTVYYVPKSANLYDAQHDALLALAEWHEGGAKPTQLIATAFSNYGTNYAISKQRPICAAPKKQKFNGTESAVNDPGSWKCE